MGREPWGRMGSNDGIRHGIVNLTFRRWWMELGFMRHCGVLVVTDDRSARMKYQGAINQQKHGVYSSHVTVLLLKLLCLWSSFLPSYYVALEAPKSYLPLVYYKLQILSSCRSHSLSEHRARDFCAGPVEWVHDGLDPTIIYLGEEHFDGFFCSRTRGIRADSGR